MRFRVQAHYDVDADTPELALGAARSTAHGITSPSWGDPAHQLGVWVVDAAIGAVPTLRPREEKAPEAGRSV